MKLSSLWTRERGQTEPLAALIAVSLVALAFGAYSVAVLDVLDQSSERELAGPTLDNIWQDIRDEGAYDNTSQKDAAFFDQRVDSDSLPQGRIVYAQIIRLTDEGKVTEVDSVRFAPDGTVTKDPAEDPPERAQMATRAISIREAPGRVHPGTLKVSVWNT